MKRPGTQTFAAVLVLILTSGLSRNMKATTILNPLGNTTPGFNNNDLVTTLQLATASPARRPPSSPATARTSARRSVIPSTKPGPIPTARSATPSCRRRSRLESPITTRRPAEASYALLDLDGSDLTTVLNAMMEVPGQGEQIFNVGTEYNVYTIDLLGNGVSAASLLDGSLVVRLALQGPGLVDNLLLNQVDESAGNDAPDLLDAPDRDSASP